jgi:NADH-quinone oxidoreductase subunit L
MAGSRNFLWKVVDARSIDGAVNGIGARARDLGGILRLLQSGNIRSYAAWVVAGSILMILGIGLWGAAR